MVKDFVWFEKYMNLVWKYPNKRGHVWMSFLSFEGIIVNMCETIMWVFTAYLYGVIDYMLF